MVLTWICAVAISAFPFITGLKMSFTHSLFETVSGWTTTGLSVVNVEKTSEIFLLWRSLTSSSTPTGILWTMIGGMFLGRLEFMVILYSLVKIMKDLRNTSS